MGKLSGVWLSGVYCKYFIETAGPENMNPQPDMAFFKFHGRWGTHRRYGKKAKPIMDRVHGKDNGYAKYEVAAWDTWDSVTMKITGPRTAAGKTHIRLVNFLYIIMFKIRKIKPNSGSVRQKPKSFQSDWRLKVEWISCYYCRKHGDKARYI